MSKRQVNLTKVIVQEDTIDIRKAFARLRNSWYLFLIFPALLLGVAYLYLRYTIPIYEVKSEILLKKDDESSVLRADALSEQLTGFGITAPTDLKDEAKILKSRTLMREVMDSLDLRYTILREGNIKHVDQYGNYPFFLDSFRISEAYREVKELPQFRVRVPDNSRYIFATEETEYEGTFGNVLETGYGKFWLRYNENRSIPERSVSGLSDIVSPKTESIYLLSIHTPLKAVLAYLKKLDVTYEKDSYVIGLSMKDEVPQRGIDILKHLIDAYNTAGIEDKNEVGQMTLSFIDDRLLRLTGELSDVEQDVENYKTREGITIDASSDLQFLLNSISRYDKEITDLEIRRSILDYLTEYLSIDSVQYELMPSNLDVGNAALTQMLLELNKKLQERKRLLQTVTDDYLGITALDNDIAGLRFNIRENIKNIQKDIEIALRQIKAKSVESERQLKKTPRRERELLEIKRQQFIKENLYLYLLQKREETAISMASTTPRAKVIDRPELVGMKPVSPQRIPIYAGALLLGFVIPIGIIIFQNIFKDTIESEEDIREMTQVPVLGRLAANKKKPKIVVREGNNSAIAELFRLLRTNIQFLIPKNAHPTLLMTSCMSGEGKSFVAINLGMSFALSGKKVVLIGLDLRKPKMVSYLEEATPDKGISDYLIGRACREEIIHSYSGNENLFYIASGPIPPNPSELILNGRLQVLIEELQTAFDIVIIDSPPVGLVTDSLLLNEMISATIFVTRYGVTRKEQLKLVDQLHKEQKLVNPAIVLSDMKNGKSYNYGYYQEG